MRSAFLAGGLLASCAWAAPRPQDIDFDLADSVPNPTYTTTLSTVTYDATAILESAMPQITSSATDDVSDASSTDVATNVKRAACDAQPTGAGPIPSPDTASAFAKYAAFASAATTAPTPSGYSKTFTNLNASSNAYGYMGYTNLKTYDVNACATKCNGINGCMAINVFYERDPSVDPGTGASGCSNPASTTNIKCVFWGGPVTADNALNFGQWRNQFQVVIAGSNGYVNNSIANPAGYSSPLVLGNAAINAPLDQYAYDSYLGSAIFNSGPFDVGLCAKACSQKSAYAIAHPPTDGSLPQTCQFFNTYILYVNTTKNLQGQYCAMYAESWPQKYATNFGQDRGYDHYKIQFSYAYSNSTNPGVAAPLPAIYQASKDISYSTLQPFCSSYLGYTTPVTTTTTLVVSTAVSTALSTTIVGTATTTVTASPNAKRTVTSLSTPSVLTKYPTAILSSACSLQATPVTVTSTSIVSSFTTTSTTTTSPVSSTTTTTTVATPTPSGCPSARGLGQFAIQADFNSLFAVPGQDFGLQFGADSASAAQLFYLDSKCILTEVTSTGPVIQAYQAHSAAIDAGMGVLLGDASTFKVNNYDPITCSIDASYNLVCAVENAVVSAMGGSYWYLADNAATIDRNGFAGPIALKAVAVAVPPTQPVSPCAFGQSLGKFGIQASSNSLYAVGGQGENAEVAFLSSSLPEAQHFFLDENCILTEADGDYVNFKAVQNSYAHYSGDTITFSSPASIAYNNLPTVKCSISTSYDLVCSVQANSVNAIDGENTQTWWLFDTALDAKYYQSMGLSSITLKAAPYTPSPCAFGQQVGNFGLRADYNRRYGANYQNGHLIKFIGGSNSPGTAQAFYIDSSCHLVYADGSYEGYVAWQDAGVTGEGVFFYSTDDIKNNGGIPMTCDIDASNYNLVCNSQGNSVFAASYFEDSDALSNTWSLWDTADNAKSQLGDTTKVPITVQAVTAQQK